MEVPIIFENNTTCTFLMLSVPGLAWPFLLGESHQQSTKAIVDHHALTITFRHPQLNTTINCQTGNPAQAFPSLIPNQNSQTAASVTCLLTGLPMPTQLYCRIPLHKGLNFVTVCLLLTTALVDSNLFHSSLYLQGNQLTEDLQVLSGPTSLSSIPSTISMSNDKLSLGRNTKCHPSEPLFAEETDISSPLSLPHAFLLPSNQYYDADTIEELPITEPSKTYFTTVVIHSSKDNISLPFNANLGFVRPMTAEDHSDFHQVAEDTSKQL